MHIRPMTAEDYDEVYALWLETSKAALSDADSRGAITRYLARNPGLSLVALEEGRIIGAALCGHDGRRGYIHHMAVLPAYRRRGVARALAEGALAGLRAEGIDKCHIFVVDSNETAARAWSAMGWEKRGHLVMYSHRV